MSFRRDKQQVADARRWRTFVDAQVELIHALGLDTAVVRSRAHFIDFLEHGYLDHHRQEPSATSSWTFSHGQLERLADLSADYFGEFGEPFDPTALGNLRYHALMRQLIEARRSP